jgi:hypothetical protein
MSRKKDWMAASHESLYNQGTQTTTYLTGSVLTRIGIAGTGLTWYNNVFIPDWNLFKNSYLAWQNPAERTAAKSAVLETSEGKFRPVYRQLYTGYMKGNPFVTDEDLVSAGFPKRHTGGGTPSPVPDSMIVVTILLLGPGRIGFDFRDEHATGKAKPHGVHGAEMISAVLDEPPTDRSQLTESSFDTHTPLVREFPTGMSGKTLYFCMRWENTRGEKGPWNRIESVVIP